MRALVVVLLFAHALGAQELITNGGFESGSSGWLASGDFHIGALPNPRSGVSYAYLSTSAGLPGNSLYGTLRQTFTVPNNISSASLRFYYSISSSDAGSSDFLTAMFEGTGTQHTFSNLNVTSGYQSYTFDLTGFAGQTLTLQFLGTTNAASPTVFRIDDVSATYVSAPTAPNAPTNLTAEGVGHTIQLAWRDNSTNESNFEIERHALGGVFGPWTSVGANTTSHQDTQSAGSITCYRVRARNASGVSGYTNEQCATSLDPPTLTYPADNETLTNVTVNLSWQNPLGSNAFGIDVGRFCGGTEVLNNQYTTETSYNLPVSAGTYVWRVRSRNTNYPGTSEPSPCRTFTISNTGNPPVASFNYTPQSPKVNASVQFEDTSSGNPTSWSWEFGDGTTAGVQHPVHSFGATGTYTVKLTVGNTSGSNNTTRQVTAGADVTAPVADFTYSPGAPLAGEQVSFTDTSANAPSTWSWDFGGTGTSTSQHPKHTFASAGTYAVKLIAGNAAGSTNKTKNVIVAAPPEGLNADFSFTPAAPLTNEAVAFTDKSTGGATSWEWDFDGNDTTDSTQRNPSRTYASAGTYSVTLTVRNATATARKTRSVTISDSVKAPIASFTYTPANPVPGQTVSFEDTSTNGPANWSWTFGNSQTSTSQHPSTTYGAAGTYTVTLTAANSAGSDQETKSITVAAAPSPTLTATLDAAPLTGDAPLSVTLSAKAGGTATGTLNYTFWWDCNDERTSVSAVTQICGTPDAKYDSVTGTTRSVTHKYESPGQYTAKVIIERGSAPPAEARRAVQAKAATGLDATLTATPDAGPAPLQTKLEVKTAGNATGTTSYTYWWHCNDTRTAVRDVKFACGDPNDPDFGAVFNATRLNSHSVTHRYVNGGTYTPKVIVERGSAPPVERRTSVRVRADLRVSLAAEPRRGSTPLRTRLEVEANPEISLPATHYLWWNCTSQATTYAATVRDCGDPRSSAVGKVLPSLPSRSSVVEHEYATAGDFVAKVLVEDAQHKTAVAHAAITAQPLELIGIEANQAIQNLANEIPLIANKDTTIVAHVRSVVGEEHTADLELVDSRTGRRLTLTQTNIVRSAPLRNDPKQAFQWQLPNDWRTGSIRATVSVRGHDLRCPTRELAGRCGIDLTFVEAHMPTFRLVPVQWPEGGKIITTPYEDRKAVAASINAMLPTANLEEGRDWDTGGVVWTYAFPSTAVAFNQIWSFLVVARLADCAHSSSCRDNYIGIINDTAPPERIVDRQGQALSHVAVAHMSDLAPAHELLHLLGHQHTKQCDEGPPFDGENPDGRISAADSGEHAMYGFDARSPDLPMYFPTAHDIMTYCSTKWISDYRYRRLVEAFRQSHGVALTAGEAAANVTIVQGHIDENGRATIDDVASLYANAALIDGFPELPESSLTVRNRSGVPLAVAPLRVTTQSGSTEAFVAIVPQSVEASTLEVSRDGQTHDIRTRAAISLPPPVITSPRAGDVFDGDTLPIRWTMSAGNRTLTYTLQYSADGGASWTVLTHGLTATAFDWSTANVPSSDAVIVRVAANDGFSTRAVESARFTIGRRPARVTIVSAPPRMSAPDTAVFEADVFDPQRVRRAADVTWSSDRDGQLGSGASLVLDSAKLQAGDHRISASVRDDAGNVLTDTVTLTVAAGSPKRRAVRR